MRLDEATFPLNRPEYGKLPELFQAALAWGLASAAEVDQRQNGAAGDAVPGYVFRQHVATTAKNVQIIETWPSEESSLRRWRQSLHDAGIVDAGEALSEESADGLLKAIEAVRPPKIKASAAIPLVPGAAFLQDPIGLHAKAHPPNFADIIEQLYRAGAKDPVRTREAASLWYESLTTPEEQFFFDALGRTIEQFVVSDGRLISKLPSSPRELDLARPVPAWLAAANTPYKWFHNAWRSFCHREWRQALPRRRWADWASCLLRTAIGMGYLWESWFYQALGRLLLAPVSEAGRGQSLLLNPEPLLEWRGQETTPASRDVNSRIRRLVADGSACRAILADFFDSQDEALPEGIHEGPDGLSELVGWISARLDHERRVALRDAFGDEPRGSAKNALETIVFSLQTRQELGSEADYYGLLARRSRRFLVVEPGLEWIVVVGSIAAGQPRSEVTLGCVKDALAQLGIGVPRSVLIAELERAGMTRSSHDADDAIVVWSGF